MVAGRPKDTWSRRRHKVMAEICFLRGIPDPRSTRPSAKDNCGVVVVAWKAWHRLVDCALSRTAKWERTRGFPVHHHHAGRQTKYQILLPYSGVLLSGLRVRRIALQLMHVCIGKLRLT